MTVLERPASSAVGDEPAPWRVQLLAAGGLALTVAGCLALSGIRRYAT